MNRTTQCLTCGAFVAVGCVEALHNGLDGCITGPRYQGVCVIGLPPMPDLPAHSPVPNLAWSLSATQGSTVTLSPGTTYR